MGTRADHIEVPDVLGLGTQDGGQAAARRKFADAGLRLGRVGWKVCASDENGLVVQQHPPAGTVVPKGSTVNIAIGGAGMGIFSYDPEPFLPGEQQPAGQPTPSVGQ